MATITQTPASTTRKFPHGRGTVCPSGYVTTVTANMTIGVATGSVLAAAPDANRNLTCEAASAENEGMEILIMNLSSTYNLVVKNPAGTTLITITPGIHGHVWNRGGTWVASL